MKRFHIASFVLCLGLLSGAAFADDKVPLDRTDKTNVGAKDGCNWQECAARDQASGNLKEGAVLLSTQRLRMVQNALVAKGYKIDEVDGKLNDDTEDALESFQKAQGLKETEDPDLPTLKALGFDVAVMIKNDVKGTEFIRTEMDRVKSQGQVGGTSEVPGTTGRVGGTVEGTPSGRVEGSTTVPAGMPIDVNLNQNSEQMPIGYVVLGKGEVKEIQKRLKKDKYFNGDTNGEITNEFVVGLRTFQKAKGIQARGLIDLETLIAMPEVDIEVEATGKPDQYPTGEKRVSDFPSDDRRGSEVPPR